MAHLRRATAVIARARVPNGRTVLGAVVALFICVQASSAALGSSARDETVLDFAKRYCAAEVEYGADDLVVYSPVRQAKIDKYPGSWQFTPNSDPFTVVASCDVKGVRGQGDELHADLVYRRLARCPGEGVVEAVEPSWETVSVGLVRRGGQWKVYDSPPPHLGLAVITKYFAEEASEDGPSWFRTADVFKLTHRRNMVRSLQVLQEVRCRELAGHPEVGSAANAGTALSELMHDQVYGELGRKALGNGCTSGLPDQEGWPPGRRAFAVSGFRIKTVEEHGIKARAIVELDVVAVVDAENATPTTRLDEVMVNLERQDGVWRMTGFPAYASLATIQEAQAVTLARLPASWFKVASKDQEEWWKRKEAVRRTLNGIELALTKKMQTPRKR